MGDLPQACLALRLLGRRLADTIAKGCGWRVNGSRGGGYRTSNSVVSCKPEGPELAVLSHSNSVNLTLFVLFSLNHL